MKNDDTRDDGDEGNVSGSVQSFRKPASRGARSAQRAASAFTASAVTELHELARSLRFALSAVVVCAGALRHQNADMDNEIALVLKACGDRLDVVIEGIENLAQSLPRAHGSG